MCKKESYVVSVAIAVAIVTMMLFFPLTATAGSLDPGTAPAPTMKTLDQIPPTWSEKITTGRFVDALGGAAVLDKETGLVWEKSPSTTIVAWANANYTCNSKSVGGREGWHLPTVEQLASLVDPSMINPSLPNGHPFTGVQSSIYWSATTNADNTANARYVNFNVGEVSSHDKTIGSYVWCVRGGQSYDGQ